MRKSASNGRISVQGIAGAHVVLLGFNAAPEETKDLVGFAVRRKAEPDGNSFWLKGQLKLDLGRSGADMDSQSHSTFLHPIQAFLWGDYTVKPAQAYTYLIVPRYLRQGKLASGPPLELTITTEDPALGTHAVIFNRGVAASQAYAREFGNKPPDAVPGRAAYAWLSRGLEEALLDFIGQAKGRGWGLRAAVYEFDYAPVLDAFRAASLRGADVAIVYDDKPGEGKPGTKTTAALSAAGLGEGIVRARKASPSAISHNKFIILLRDGEPVQVWTGSTNISKGGIFGHSNVGHVVRDPGVAKLFLYYWKELNEDPQADVLRGKDEALTPLDASGPPSAGTHAVFSPRSSLEALEWYARLMDQAKSAVFLTAAFGICREFSSVIDKDAPYLKYLLLEKGGKGITLIKRRPSNRVSVGALIEGGVLDEWFAEERLSGLNAHVKYIHTKYMLVDPLSEDPIVIAGSANFSEASTTKNDENMLVIRGDRRVADIYLGEFMRLFLHYKFRSRMSPARPGRASLRAGGAPSLTPDDSWARPYYKADSSKEKERLLFGAEVIAASGGHVWDTTSIRSSSRSLQNRRLTKPKRRM
jgi:phosphatidylserine/phosphatidylglycerophosphate/cardiolipin synthase-like enzyme